jgi:hypothetical protein
MKSTVLVLALCSMLPAPLMGESSLREVIDRNLAAVEQPKAEDKAALAAPPELAERVQGLFLRYPVAHIVSTHPSATGTTLTTDIYVAGEEVYVLEANEGWNLAATTAGVFEWEKGKKTGFKIKRNNEDLFAYLCYVTDPAGLMSALYASYRKAPEKFTATVDDKKGWTELRLNARAEGLEAIYISEKPLWFRGLRMTNPATGKSSEMLVSEPQEIKQLPEAIGQQLKKIKFEGSNLSLKRHMTFL